MPTAIWLWIVVSWSLLMLAIGYGVGYHARDKEERAKRTDWTPSQVDYKNVRNLNNYRALTRGTDGRNLAGGTGAVRLSRRV